MKAVSREALDGGKSAGLRAETATAGDVRLPVDFKKRRYVSSLALRSLDSGWLVSGKGRAGAHQPRVDSLRGFPQRMPPAPTSRKDAVEFSVEAQLCQKRVANVHDARELVLLQRPGQRRVPLGLLRARIRETRAQKQAARASLERQLHAQCSRECTWQPFGIFSRPRPSP